MKDEIKEILEDLEWRAKSHDIWYFMEQEKCKILYDYITNLQEENERLKNYQESYIKELDYWRIQYDNCMLRNLKAINYIKKIMNQI